MMGRTSPGRTTDPNRTRALPYDARMIRKTVYYSGRVQGVGFRWTAERYARHHAVNGYVQNLDDGRVRLVAEGEKDEVDRLLTEVRDAMFDNIRGTDVAEAPATGEFHGFAVRH